MEIILYAMPDSIVGQTLEKILKDISSNSSMNRFYSLQRFIQHIVEHRIDDHIIIMVVERPKELIALHSLFQDTKTSNLIIVCDDSQEMITLAHELRPRFLAHANEAQKVKAVVEKMISTSQKEKGE